MNADSLEAMLKEDIEEGKFPTMILCRAGLNQDLFGFLFTETN